MPGGIFFFFLCRAEILSGGRPRPAPPTVATTLILSFPCNAKSGWARPEQWKKWAGHWPTWFHRHWICLTLAFVTGTVVAWGGGGGANVAHSQEHGNFAELHFIHCISRVNCNQISKLCEMKG